MRGDIENPMVDPLLRYLEQSEPKEYGECAGCHEDIKKGEAFFDVEISYGVFEKVHQKGECCMDYVAAMSYCRTAGA